jgi:hypothetical protein
MEPLKPNTLKEKAGREVLGRFYCTPTMDETKDMEPKKEEGAGGPHLFGDDDTHHKKNKRN